MATEYISREAAMSMPWANGQYDHEHANEHFICGLETYKEWLEQIPAADVVEVVRCRDCIYGDPDPSTSSEIFCEKHCRWLSKDHYCADGKRREPHD